ncbi:hypothetical protein [Bradyrhizobium xenonodulans]|uniref:hypothetical protein n=1 Tax=Bradyrhizobium xenonodulans TaxID=2736875 RepID=UPI00351DF1BD
MTNCFKNAFPEGRPGTVKVDVRAKEGRVLVTVQDDGVGCPVEVKSGLGAAPVAPTITRQQPQPRAIRRALAAASSRPTRRS